MSCSSRCSPGPNRASGPALSTAALFTRSDPIFSDSQRKDLVRELEERAAGRDARLWYPRLMLALSQVERSGLTEAVTAVGKLVDEFPEVPAILRELSKLYAELGWNAERSRTALELARRFPDDPLALEPAIGVLDAQGRAAEADALVGARSKARPRSSKSSSRARSNARTSRKRWTSSAGSPSAARSARTRTWRSASTT